MEKHEPDAQPGQPGSGGVVALENAEQATAKSWLRVFGALQQRNYRLYWSGQLVSLIGTAMQRIGQAWLVLELTGSAWQLGIVGALQFLPILLFSLFGGVLADRWPKRRVLLITQTISLCQALLLWLLIATHAVQLWHVYILAFLLGLTNCLDQPTRSAFVVEMVGRENLPNAIALSSSMANLTLIVGPGLGGMIIAVGGVGPLFLFNALSFLAVLLGLALIKTGELHISEQAGEHQSAWGSLREGVGYVWNTPSISLVIVIVGLVLLLGANFEVVLPLFATTVLHAGAAGLGFLSATSSLGALGAALWLAWTSRHPTLSQIFCGLLVFGVLEACFALSPFYPLSLVVIAGMGAAETIFGALATTFLQTVPPDHLRGRVASVYILFFTGSIPPGYLLAGWLSSILGAPLGLLICALLCLLVTGAGWLWKRM